MYVFLYSDTRTGSTCAGKWIADSIGVPFLDEWVGLYFHEASDCIKNGANYSAEMVLDNAIKLLKDSHPHGAVVKIMYHDLPFAALQQQKFGPFSHVAQRLVMEPARHILMLRKDVLASSISSYLSIKSGLFHKPVGSGSDCYNSVSSDAECFLPNEQDVVNILDDYEGRLISSIFARFCLGYYFGDRLAVLDYETILNPSDREKFISSYFPGAISAELKYEKVSKRTEQIRSLIELNKVDLIRKKVIRLIGIGVNCIDS